MNRLKIKVFIPWTLYVNYSQTPLVLDQTQWCWSSSWHGGEKKKNWDGGGGCSDLNDVCFSQLKVIKHGGVVSIQIHQVLMAALLCDAAVTHEDHFITVHQILITEIGQGFGSWIKKLIYSTFHMTGHDIIIPGAGEWQRWRSLPRRCFLMALLKMWFPTWASRALKGSSKM